VKSFAGGSAGAFSMKFGIKYIDANSALLKSENWFTPKEAKGFITLRDAAEAMFSWKISNLFWNSSLVA